MIIILVIEMLLNLAKCMNTSQTSSNAIWNNKMTKHMENNRMEKKMSPAGRVARKGGSPDSFISVPRGRGKT